MTNCPGRLLADPGVDVEVVLPGVRLVAFPVLFRLARPPSEYLGHHDPAITLRVYAHLLPSAEQRVLKVIDEILDAQAQPPSDPREPRQSPGQG